MWYLQRCFPPLLSLSLLPILLPSLRFQVGPHHVGSISASGGSTQTGANDIIACGGGKIILSLFLPHLLSSLLLLLSLNQVEEEVMFLSVEMPVRQ